MRQHLHHAVDQAGNPPRTVQRMPPVLHRQAEAGRLRWSGRAVPTSLRNHWAQEARRSSRSLIGASAPTFTGSGVLCCSTRGDASGGRYPWPVLNDRLSELEREYDAVVEELNDPSLSKDPRRLRDVSRRHRELGEV